MERSSSIDSYSSFQRSRFKEADFRLFMSSSKCEDILTENCER